MTGIRCINTLLIENLMKINKIIRVGAEYFLPLWKKNKINELKY